jgi:hypothetical protein
MRVAARSRTRARGPAASAKMASMNRAARVSLSSLEATGAWAKPLYLYLRSARGEPLVCHGGRTEEEGEEGR